MCITNDKPFLTYEQQIQKLTDKGLTINDHNAAIKLLKYIDIWDFLLTGLK